MRLKSIVVAAWSRYDMLPMDGCCSDCADPVRWCWWRTSLLALITDGLMVIILPFAIHSMPRIFLKCNPKLDACIFKALQCSHMPYRTRPKGLSLPSTKDAAICLELVYLTSFQDAVLKPHQAPHQLPYWPHTPRVLAISSARSFYYFFSQ